MTHADGFFAMGKAHTVCQDYVRTGTTQNGRAYAIVADGCSSSKDTDIGARLLVRAAENFVRNEIPVQVPAIIAQARTYAAAMSLPPTCLDATLLIAEEKGNSIYVYMVGDGVVACRGRNGGKPFVFQVEYPSGAPFYPNYYMDAHRFKAFYDMPNHDPVVSRTEKSEVWQVPGTAPTEMEAAPDRDDFLHYTEQGHIIWFHVPKAEFDLVTLMSDGAASFRKELAPIPVEEIVEHVLGVKVPTGEFIVRCCKKFLGSFCSKEGWSHYDDFSVGAIFIEPPQEEP